MSKKREKAEERDHAVLRMLHKLTRQLPTGTKRVELDVEFVDGTRIKHEVRA